MVIKEYFFVACDVPNCKDCTNNGACSTCIDAFGININTGECKCEYLCCMFGNNQHYILFMGVVGFHLMHGHRTLFSRKRCVQYQEI